MHHSVTAIHYDRAAKVLDVTFAQGDRFRYRCEFLRVHSPSAEVRGHGFTTPLLVTDKEHVSITDITPVGNYAVKLCFDDGHDSGLYSWDYLYELGKEYDTLWHAYQARLTARATLDSNNPTQ